MFVNPCMLDVLKFGYFVIRHLALFSAVKCLFPGQNVEEITVKADQYVTVIRNFNDGWLKVQIDDKEGFIPESYTGV